MLEKDRFLDIKEMARNVREDNRTLFQAFKQESAEDAIREKDEFIETIIDSMDINFSAGELGKEEKQIFRANVLIPDDDEFFETYSKNKNIRDLMKHYAVSIEDIMSKITELNIYSSYLNSSRDNKIENGIEAELKEEYAEAPTYAKQPNDNSFVDAMVNLSSNDAANLLDEIESLSKAMEGFNVKGKEEKPNFNFDEKENKQSFNFDYFKKESKEEKPEIKVQEEKKEPSYSSDMSIDDISEAVDGFVDDYNSIQTDLKQIRRELDNHKRENKDLKEQLRTLKDEAYEVQKNNLESSKTLKEARKRNERLENENFELREQIRTMQDQLKRTSDLLKKIYQSIPRR